MPTSSFENAAVSASEQSHQDQTTELADQRYAAGQNTPYNLSMKQSAYSSQRNKHQVKAKADRETHEHLIDGDT